MATDVAATPADVERSEVFSTGYEIFIGALSVLSLVNLLLIAVLRSESTRTVVYVVDGVLSFIFLVDFSVRLHRSKDRAGYFWRRFGWADLLASVPFPQAKILRVFRLLRVWRLMRRYGVRSMLRQLFSDRAANALLTLLLVGILVLEFGSIAILHVEEGAPGANIETASDSLWYVIVTMSTVGYGDQYPVTNAGRELGSLVIIVGVAIFGTLTGYLANLFLAPRKASTAQEGTQEADVTAQIAHIRELITQQQDALAQIELAAGGAD